MKGKTLLTMLAALLFGVAAQAQITELPYNTSFETGFEGWTAVDNDGDGNNWYTTTSAHNGTGALGSDSYLHDVYSPVEPDNILISPAITLSGENLNLTYWIKTDNVSYPAEHIAVYVVTDTTIAAITAATPVEEYTMTSADGSWTKHTVSLDTYVDQTIHIVFRHYDCYDEYWLYLDDVTVGSLNAPEVSLVNLTGTAHVGEDANFAAVVTAGSLSGMTYTWSSLMATAGDATITPVDSLATIVYSAEGIDTVSVTATNAYGSLTTKVAVKVVSCEPIDELPWNIAFYDFQYDVEGGDSAISCWNVVDADLSGDTWVFSGNGYMFAPISATTPADDWAILPQVTIPADASGVRFDFIVQGTTGTNSTYYEVLASPTGTGNIEDFTDLLYSETTGEVVEHSLSLAQYAGQTIRIAFRHYVAGDAAMAIHYVGFSSSDSVVAQIIGPAVADVNTEVVYHAGMLAGSTSGVSYTWSSVMGAAGTATTVADADSLVVTYTAIGFDTITLVITNDFNSDTVSMAVKARDLSPITEFPYSTGFEAEQDVNWQLANGDNGWYIGSATNNGGTNGLYISNDNGTTNAYTNNAASYSYAYRAFTFAEAGEYAISFDWKNKGEEGWDFLRAFIAPGSMEISDNTSINNLTKNSLPGGCIALDGGSELSNSTEWQSQFTTFNITTPGNYLLVFYWRNDASMGSNPPAAIDNVEVAQLVCSSPVNLVLDTATETSLAFHWSHGGSESSWEVTVGDLDPVVVNDTTYLAEDLSASTSYNVRVRAVCSDDEVSFALSENFRTACGAITVFPWSEGFEAGGEACWSILSFNGYASDDWRVTTSNTHSGTQCLYSTYTWDDVTYDWAITPAITLPEDASSFVFEWFDYGRGDLAVLLSNTTADTSAFTDTLYFGVQTDYEYHQHSISLEDYAGQTIYVAFVHDDDDSDGDGYAIYIDDISVRATTMPVVAINGSTVADVNIDASYSVTLLEGSTDNITYDWTSTMQVAGNATMNTYDDSIVINYTAVGVDTIKVVATNDFGADSAFIVVNVRDLAPVTTLPYSTGFETGDDVNWQLANGANGWYIGTAAQNGGTNGLYISNDGGATNAYTGTISYSYAYRAFSLEAGEYIAVFDWQCNGESTYDYLRAFMAPSTVAIAADQSITGLSTNTLPAGCMPLDGGTKLNLGTEWTSQNGTFTVSEDGVYLMVFYWKNDGSLNYNPPAAIDNIQLAALTCPAPTALTLDEAGADEIEFHWTASGDESNWEVTIGDNEPVIVDATNFTALNLDEATAYTVRVRAICGPGDTSFAVSATYNTIQTPVTELPFTTGFEPTDNNSWIFSNDGDNAWMIGTDAQNGGTSSLYVSNDGTTNSYDVNSLSNSYVYRTFTLQAGTYNVSYDYKVEGEYNWDYLRVFATPATGIPGASSYDNIDLDGGEQLQGQSTWTTISDTLEIANAGNYYIVFYWHNDGSMGTNPPAAIDNFSLTVGSVDTTVTPVCDVPTNLNATNITTTSAKLQWTNGGDETEWDLNLNGTVTRISANPHTLTGLTPATNYTVRLRAVCGEADMSPWTDAYTFTTLSQTDTTGIDGVNGVSFALYPNPTTNVVTIDLANYDLNDAYVSVIDLNGREVSRTVATETTTIDLTNVARGAYFVRVVTNEGSAVRKLIVQ